MRAFPRPDSSFVTARMWALERTDADDLPRGRWLDDVDVLLDGRRPSAAEIWASSPHRSRLSCSPATEMWTSLPRACGFLCRMDKINLTRII